MLGVKVTGMAEVVATLNGFDKTIVRQARIDLKTALDPVVRSVRSNIPREAPMSGMQHMGRTGWNLSGVKVNVRVNFSKRAERRGNQLVSIVAGGKGQGGAAFAISDMAGRRTSGKTRAGRNMVKVLNERNGSASRFVYPAAEAALPYVENQLRGTIRELSRKYNIKLKR
jgi:hypothetical protein